MADALQLVLIGQVVRDAAERIDDAVVLALEDRLGELELAPPSCGSSSRCPCACPICHIGGSTAPSSRPFMSRVFCITWCIM